MSNYTYVIVNKINLKLYFGSHSWDGEGLDKNYYGSGKIIKQAVKKYGKDNFIVYPIKFYDTIEECRQAEEQLLIKYNIASNPYCYNIKNGAIGMTSEDMMGKNNPMYGRTGEKHPRYGRTHTENTRQKISQIHKGKTLSEETKKKLIQSKKNIMTPIVAIQKDTGKIRVFESIKECARQLNLNRGNIHNCLLGRQKSTGGYTFKKINRDKRVFTVSKRSKADINRLRGIA